MSEREGAPDEQLRAGDTPESMSDTPVDRSASGAPDHPHHPSDPSGDAPDATSEPPEVSEADAQKSPATVTPRNDDPRPDTGRRSANPPAAGPAARSVLIAAAVTGAWAAVVSFAPVLIVVLLGWFGSTAVSAGTAVRFAVTGWLLGHGVPFTASHGVVGLMPLALTALVVWRLVRAGAHTARAVAATPRDVPYVVGALSLGYGVLGSLAALGASTPYFRISPLVAFAVTGLIAALASTPGALVETGGADQLWRWCPKSVRGGLRGGLVAGLGVLAAGAALAGLATATAYQDAVDLYRGYDAGVAGGAGITLVGLLYAPNLAIWGASYLVGPGFGFGVGTGVTVFDVSLGPLPAVPVLAGLPTGPAPTAVGMLLAVPVLAGMFVGVSTAWRDPGAGWGPLLWAAGLTGPVAGALLAAAGFAAGGSLGSGSLAEIGPTWWQVGLVATALVAAGALLAAAAARLLASKL